MLSIKRYVSENNRVWSVKQDDSRIPRINWYQKDTCSGWYLSYFSSYSLCHKIYAIYDTIYELVVGQSNNIFVTSNFPTKKFEVRNKGIIRKYLSYW